MKNNVKKEILSRGAAIWSKLVKYRQYYLILLPVLLFFAVFSYGPMYGVIIAFKDFNMSKGIIESPWADPVFKYFIRAFKSEIFTRALWNTVVISFLKIILAFPIPIIFAILIDELPRKRFAKTVQTISYLPYFISWVVLGGIIRSLLSPSTGAINYIIEMFGATPIHFLGEANMFRGIIFLSYIWQSVGYGSVVYLAAIAGIDQEQYEAARIDGASRFQSILKVTVPNILPVIIIMFIMNLGNILNAGFDQIFNLYSPMTYQKGDIIDTYVYRVGLVDFEYSYSTAVGLFKNIIGLTLVLATNFMARKFDPDSALF